MYAANVRKKGQRIHLIFKIKNVDISLIVNQKKWISKIPLEIMHSGFSKKLKSTFSLILFN